MSVLREEAAFHGETLGATQFLHVLNAAQKSYKLWHSPLKFYSIKIFQMINSTNDFQILVNKHMLGWFVVFLQNSHIKYVFSTFFRFMSVFFWTQSMCESLFTHHFAVSLAWMLLTRPITACSQCDVEGSASSQPFLIGRDQVKGPAVCSH